MPPPEASQSDAIAAQHRVGTDRQGSAVQIAYDATRLFLGPLSRTPRGIDRVDLEYARHFFSHADECCAVLPTIWGTRIFSRDRVLRGLTRLEELWSEHISPEQDVAWHYVKAQLQGHAPPDHDQARNRALVHAGRMTSLLKATGIGFGTSVVTGLAPGAIYLNIGQTSLSIPFLLRWLDRRHDVCPLFMLHDVIPLQTPEYVESGAVKGHAAMVTQTARRAAGLIVTTQTAKAAVQAELQRRGAPSLPTLALPLPVQPIFHTGANADPSLADISYFVVCGAIEHRKNQLLLLEVWRRLRFRLGQAMPHLVIVGSPGWQGQAIKDRLQRSIDVNQHVHIVSGLSTPALHRLLSGARALLMPSLIEGFGLPVVEAGVMGIPVVASDIPAHREVAHPATIFVDPIDGPGWEAAILALCDLQGKQTHHKGIYAKFTWEEYFIKLSSFIREVKSAGRR
jgi:glycosyltransferase involved in cell wall biosynthesis